MPKEIKYRNITRRKAEGIVMHSAILMPDEMDAAFEAAYIVGESYQSSYAGIVEITATQIYKRGEPKMRYSLSITHHEIFQR